MMIWMSSPQSQFRFKAPVIVPLSVNYLFGYIGKFKEQLRATTFHSKKGSSLTQQDSKAIRSVKYYEYKKPNAAKCKTCHTVSP